jgi:aryl-alcohol dehydrogenase-like predicted oxidoreductase
MLQYCQAHSIKLFAYGSVGCGLLSDKYVEAPRKGLFGG